MPEKRNFTIVGSSIHKEGGTYKSSTPLAAAKKAATQQFKIAPTGTEEIKLMVQEKKSENASKTFFYRATRKKLDNPVERVVVFNGKEVLIKNEWETKLEKCNAWSHHDK
jgi:hypothetical protein